MLNADCCISCAPTIHLPPTLTGFPTTSTIFHEFHSVPTGAGTFQSCYIAIRPAISLHTRGRNALCGAFPVQWEKLSGCDRRLSLPVHDVPNTRGTGAAAGQASGRNPLAEDTGLHEFARLHQGARFGPKHPSLGNRHSFIHDPDESPSWRKTWRACSPRAQDQRTPVCGERANRCRKAAGWRAVMATPPVRTLTFPQYTAAGATKSHNSRRITSEPGPGLCGWHCRALSLEEDSAPL